MKLFVRDKDGLTSQTYDYSANDTIERVKQMIAENKKCEGNIRLHFPGLSREIADTDKLSTYFPEGRVTVDIDTESDLEDDDSDASGNGQCNDLHIAENEAGQDAKQFNFVVVAESVHHRATKVKVVNNKALRSAGQCNAALSGLESFKALLSADLLKSGAK
ncbi:hypothetical protein F4808DRAFT_455595 [Astrocystis sublimbata]|nr:hypothetical protein F4808DRAFT_455595 [Astrocystis sublimbata]